jgi:hypothetical protein
MKKQSHAAVEAVARQFSALCEENNGSHGAWMTPAGRQIAVGIAMINREIGKDKAVRPRLRFDKVVIRLIGQLQASLHDTVSDGRTMKVTVTAPIRLAAKTAAALEQTIRTALAGRPARVDIKDTICGNQIRVRIMKTGLVRAPRLLGFVHNPDPGADLALLDCTEAVLERMAGIG